MNKQRVSLAFLALVGLLVLSPTGLSNPGDRGSGGGGGGRPSGGGSSRPAPQSAPSRPAPQSAPSRPAPQSAPSRPAPQSAPSRPAPQSAPSRPAPQSAPARPAPSAPSRPEARPSSPPVLRERPAPSAPASRPSEATPFVRERPSAQPRYERPAGSDGRSNERAGPAAPDRAPRYLPDAGSNSASRPRVTERGDTNDPPATGGRTPFVGDGGGDSARGQSGSFVRPNRAPSAPAGRAPEGSREQAGADGSGARGDASPGRRVFDDERVPPSGARPRGRVFDSSPTIDLTDAALPPRARVPSLSGTNSGGGSNSGAGSRSGRGVESAPPSAERTSLGWRRLEAIDKAARAGEARPLPSPIGGTLDGGGLADRYRGRSGLAQPRDERPAATGGGGLERDGSRGRGPALSDQRRGGTKTDARGAPTSGARTPNRDAVRPRDGATPPANRNPAPTTPTRRSPRAAPGSAPVVNTDGQALASRTTRLRELARTRPTEWSNVTASGASVSYATSLGLTVGFSTASSCFGGSGFYSPYYSGNCNTWNNHSSWNWCASWCWGASSLCWPGYGWGFNYWCDNWGFSYGYSPYWNNCNYGYPTYYSGVIYDTYEPAVVVREVPVYVEVPAAEPAPEAEPAAHGEGAIGVPRGAAPDAASERNGAASVTATIYLDKGDAAWREGRYADAVHFYAKAVEFSPDEGVLHLILADALFSTGDYHYAAFSLRKALELDPGLLESTLDKHTLYPEPRVFDEQLAVLEQYVADHPIDDDARLLLAANYLFGKRPAQCADVLESPYAVALRETVIGKLVLDRARELRTVR